MFIRMREIWREKKRTMKELLARLLRFLMKGSERKMSERPRRVAAKSIAKAERNGGYALRCGCLIHVKSEDLRRIMETFGPETVLEVEAEVRASHEHKEAELESVRLP
jgi:hypothetical protein